MNTLLPKIPYMNILIITDRSEYWVDEAKERYKTEYVEKDEAPSKIEFYKVKSYFASVRIINCYDESIGEEQYHLTIIDKDIPLNQFQFLKSYSQQIIRTPEINLTNQ